MPPIYWKATMLRGMYGPPHFASFDETGTAPFASVSECVNDRAGQWLITIRREPRPRLYAYVGSLEHGKRMVERWASAHWRTVPTGAGQRAR